MSKHPATAAAFTAKILFLGANALLYSMVLWGTIPRARFLVLALPLICVLSAAKRGLFPHVLAAFGAGLMFFGFQSYSPHSLVLHVLTSWTAMCCVLEDAMDYRHGPRRPGPLRIWFLAFLGIVFSGVFLLPLGQLAQTARDIGVLGLARMAAFSPAASSAYAAAAMNRLALFALLAWELSRLRDHRALPALFEGLAAGLPAALAFGLAEYFLARGKAFALSDRLTSLFLNPGWFAEYACLSFPLLFGLGKARRLGRWLFFAVMAAAVAAMVLTMARAAWLVFGLLAVVGVILSLAGFDLFGLDTRRLSRGLLLGGGAVLGAALVLYWSLAVSKLSLRNFPLATMISQRLERFSESPRPAIFKSGILIGLEAPVAGMGYETYAWHYPHLMAAPQSLLASHGDPKAEVFEATHNLFIQIFVGSGLLGLAAWLLLMARVLRLEFRHHRRRGDPLSLGVLALVLAFHGFGLFQEMIYVPAVWLMMFVVLAHALRLEDAEGGWPGKLAARRAGWLAVGVVGLALAVNAAGAGQLRLARSLGLGAYPAPGSQDMQGLSGPEAVEGRQVLWSSGASSFVLTGQGPWQFELGCPHPDLAARAVRAVLRDGNKVLAETVFDAGHDRTASLAVTGEQARPGDRLYLTVSRPYCPMVSGIKDFRCLGVWISGPGLTPPQS